MIANIILPRLISFYHGVVLQQPTTVTLRVLVLLLHISQPPLKPQPIKDRLSSVIITKGRRGLIFISRLMNSFLSAYLKNTKVLCMILMI
jgi:uncharacterized membrane protein